MEQVSEGGGEEGRGVGRDVEEHNLRECVCLALLTCMAL